MNIFWRISICLAPSMIMAGCQASVPVTAGPPPDSKYSSGLKSKEPFPPPYVECYRRSPKELCFIAAAHQGGYGSTHSTIDKVFEDFGPQAIILEDFETEKAGKPEYLSRRKLLCSDIHSKKCDEGSYTMVVAGRKKVPLLAGEPTDLDIKNRILTLGHSLEDLLGFYTVRQIPSWKRDGTFQQDNLPKRVDMFIQDYAKRLRERTDFDWLKFKTWFALKTGKEFLAEAITTEDPAPISGPGTTKINAISCDVGKFRDAHLMSEIDKALEENNRVLVVYGQGHLAVNRTKLQDVFGSAGDARKY
jgi:hypothetical protein